MPCPITVAYLKRVRQAFGEKNPTLYEDLFTALEELEDQAERSAPSNAVVRLRAFYSLEHMYEKVVPQACYGTLPRVVSVQEALQPEVFMRSWRGLGKLLDYLNRLGRLMVIESTEIELCYGLGVTDEILNDSLEQIEELIIPCRRAAEVLRRELRDPIKDIHRVGMYLGELMDLAERPGEEMIFIGRAILAVYL